MPHDHMPHDHMPHDTDYFSNKANHCTRLARLIKDPVIKAELQTLAREFMAEAHRLAEPACETPAATAVGRERRLA
jgi:hypothetical protein